VRGGEFIMKKIYLYAVIAALATLFATTIATSACWVFFYQPNEPVSLRDE
jgi:AgrD protein